MGCLTSWTVFCRVTWITDFVAVGKVLAATHDEALALAGRLPNAPAYPIVCHAHVDPKRVVVDRSGQIETDRKNRRRAA